MNKKLFLFIGILGILVLSACEIQKDIVEPIDETPIDTPIHSQNWLLYKDQFNAWSCNDKTRTTEIEETIAGDRITRNFELLNTFLSEEECVDFCLDVPTPEREGNDCEERNRRIQCLKQSDKLFLGGLEGTCIDKQDNDACINAGGLGIKWFSNGCVDSCGAKPRLCTEAFRLGCDCGATKCYGSLPCLVPEGQSCTMEVKLGCMDDPYEPYATQQEACEKTNGLWQKTGTRCPVIKDVEIVDGKKIETCPVQEEDIINCQCPEGELFYTDGCSAPRADLMSIIAWR